MKTERVPGKAGIVLAIMALTACLVLAATGAASVAGNLDHDRITEGLIEQAAYVERFGDYLARMPAGFPSDEYIYKPLPAYADMRHADRVLDADGNELFLFYKIPDRDAVAISISGRRSCYSFERKA